MQTAGKQRRSPAQHDAVHFSEPRRRRAAAWQQREQRADAFDRAGPAFAASPPTPRTSADQRRWRACVLASQDVSVRPPRAACGSVFLNPCAVPTRHPLQYSSPRGWWPHDGALPLRLSKYGEDVSDDASARTARQPRSDSERLGTTRPERLDGGKEPGLVLPMGRNDGTRDGGGGRGRPALQLRFQLGAWRCASSGSSKTRAWCT